MAKLGLLFIAIFCIIQLTFAASRFTRDTDTNKDISDVFNEYLATAKKGFDETFTKENLDKLTKTLSEAGDKAVAIAKDVAAKGQEKFSEITKKD